MLQAQLESSSGSRNNQEPSSSKNPIVVDYAIPNQSSQLIEVYLSNEPGAQRPPKAASNNLMEFNNKSGFPVCKANPTEKLLETLSHKDWPYFLSMLDDNDPFSWDIEKIVQFFNSSISSQFADTLRDHEVDGWTLLQGVTFNELKEGLLVNDVAQEEMIQKSILDLRQKSKGM